MKPECKIVRSDDPELAHAPYAIVNTTTGRLVCTGLESKLEAERIVQCVSELSDEAANRLVHAAAPPDSAEIHEETINGKQFRTFRPRQQRTQSGSVLVETALVVVFVLFPLIFGSLDLSRAESAKGSLNYITSQAATCASKPPCNVATYIAGSAPGLGLNTSVLTYTVAANTVTTSYHFQPLLPFFPSLVLTATASAN